MLDDPTQSAARRRELLAHGLSRSEQELRLKRAGTEEPVLVAIAPGLRAVAPVPATLRADASAADERTWLLVAALAGALVQAGAPGATLHAGELDGRLVLDVAGDDAELAALAFDTSAERIDRLRTRAAVVAPDTLAEARDLREPIGATHPLRVAAALAALGADPAESAAHDEHEEAVLALLDPTGAARAATRPHDDPDPDRRVARRILQRLAGMGKWGGFHTEFAHLARGFAGDDRARAQRVGEALIAGGLLKEKPSVGQRHVFLDPRRARDIHALIDDGEVPPGLGLD